MTLLPTASWVSMNSRSKRSIKTSRFPGWSVYCLSSTIGQQNCEDCACFKLSEVGSVMLPKYTRDAIFDQQLISLFNLESITKLTALTFGNVTCTTAMARADKLRSRPAKNRERE